LTLEQAGDYALTRGRYAYELTIDVKAGEQDGRLRYELRRSVGRRSKLIGMRRTGIAVWAASHHEALKEALGLAARRYGYCLPDEESVAFFAGLRDQQHHATGGHDGHDARH
jgi:hypothetical protein